MAKYTENIRLAQPEGSDYYDIEVFNHNSELIDKKIGEMDNSLATIKEGATREKAGIVQLGTEEGKALEGMMLARLAGAYGYGGDIQDEGVKNPNYIYYDRNTRKMYKCLKQNQDISANVTNFIPLDNNSLLERLENLITFDNNNALKIKVINVTLNTNILIGDSINVDGIPNTTVFVTGFLYNYIKQEKTNIYEYWDLQVSHPNKCIIRKIKNYGFTSYATILAFYK